jgi:hypothetical protein
MLNSGDLVSCVTIGGRPPIASIGEFVELLKDGAMCASAFESVALQELGIHRASFYRYLRRAKEAGLISKDQKRQEWQLVRPVEHTYDI